MSLHHTKILPGPEGSVKLKLKGLEDSLECSAQDLHTLVANSIKYPGAKSTVGAGDFVNGSIDKQDLEVYFSLLVFENQTKIRFVIQFDDDRIFLAEENTNTEGVMEFVQKLHDFTK